MACLSPRDPLDQSSGQAQRRAQPALLPFHLPMIALMVEARQMQNSMQRQNLHFVRGRVSQLRRALLRHVCGNRNLACQSQRSGCPRRIRRKRQNIRLFVLPTKLTIQGSHFRAAGHKQVDRALESGSPARAKQKSLQPRFTQTCDRLLQDNQLASASSATFSALLCDLNLPGPIPPPGPSLKRSCQNRREGPPRALPA